MRLLVVFWRLFHGLLFYPLLIALFLWLYFTDKHWIYGAAIIIAILILDPIWRVIGKRILEMILARGR